MILLILFIILCCYGLWAIWRPKKIPIVSYTKEDSQRGQQIIIETIQQFPQTTLSKQFPYLTDVAHATNRYNELNECLKKGEIDLIDYNIELDKILPYIKLNY